MSLYMLSSTPESEFHSIFALQLAISKTSAIFLFPFCYNANFQSFFLSFKVQISKFYEETFVLTATWRAYKKLG